MNDGTTAAPIETTEAPDTPALPAHTASDVVGAGVPEWAQGYSDDNKEWIASKGIKEPEALAKSYRELESKFGADRAGKTIVLPDAGDTEAMASVFNALGRPETPEGYELIAPDDANPEFTNGISQALFDAGVSMDSAKLLASKVQELAASATAADNEQWNKASAAELDTWKRDQGVKVNESIAAANSAAQQFGLSRDDISDIERAIGTGRTMGLLSKIGAGLSEDTLPQAARGPATTDIKGEISRMMSDPEIRSKINSGDYATKQKWDALHDQLQKSKSRA